MKFQGVSIAMLLALTSHLVSASEQRYSSDVGTDKKKVSYDSDNFSDKNWDGIRSLKAGKSKAKKIKSSKSKKAVIPTMGSQLSKPHKMEYEKRTQCIPGLNIYGCSDSASKSNGGGHIHEMIAGQKYVMHKGAFVAKGHCDTTDQVTEGIPPEPPSVKYTPRQCKPLMDPNDHFTFVGVDVIEGTKYNKFMKRVITPGITDDQRRAMHLTATGLAPDTIYHLEDTYGTPYLVQSYNAGNLLHETKVTKFELLSEGDERRNTREILTSFVGGKLERNLYEPANTKTEMSVVTKEMQSRDLTDRYVHTKIIVPPTCTLTDAKGLCLRIDLNDDLETEETTFDLGLNINYGGSGVKLDIQAETGKNGALEMIQASAEGCIEIEPGIKTSLIKLGMDVCMKGQFEYDSKKDTSPKETKYELDVSVDAAAKIEDIGPNLKIEGKLILIVQDDSEVVYFLGMEGFEDLTVNLVIVDLTVGLGMKHETPSYEASKKEDGWATDLFYHVKFDIDLWFWSLTHSFQHAFYCHPGDNPICGGHFLTPTEKLNGNTLEPKTKMSALPVGGHIRSHNGKYKLIQQADGNLELLKGDENKLLWSNGMRGKSVGVTIMQDDGNFASYLDNDSRVPVWSTNTVGAGQFTRIVLQNDGNLVMYDNLGENVWSTNTAQSE